MSPRRSAIVLTVVAVLLLAANLVFTAHYVSSSQRNWCATLDLLSAHPVHKPPRSTQFARSGAYTFYLDILDLRHRFGCG